MYYLPESFHLKDSYLNKGLAYLFGDTIYEYDMRSAGLNLIIYYQLLPQSEIDKLQAMDKKRRDKKIGVMCRDNKDLNKALNKEAFSNMRKMFYEANEIEPNDIVSVKKDAIFLRKSCLHTTFGNVEFRVKHQYTSFIQLEGTEIYYQDSHIDVKGINDERVTLHQEGIISFLSKLIRRIEADGKVSAYRYLCKYVTLYKNRVLPLSHYREFNANSMYVELGGEKYNEYWDDKVYDLDIRYNWEYVILPIVSMLY